jgi:uncharacterized coiled-coil protein SlyX
MIMRSLAVGILLLVAGCAHWPPSNQPAVGLTEIDDLDSNGLIQERDAALTRYRQQPDDETRLRLAYVLSRPDPSTQDLEASRRLLDEIGSDSDYAALRDALRREIALLNELENARRRADVQQARLDAIESDLVTSQELSQELTAYSQELAANRRELRMLHRKLEELQGQLDALRAIEADLADDETLPEGTGQ